MAIFRVDKDEEYVTVSKIQAGVPPSERDAPEHTRYTNSAEQVVARIPADAFITFRDLEGIERMEAVNTADPRRIIEAVRD